MSRHIRMGIIFGAIIVLGVVALGASYFYFRTDDSDSRANLTSDALMAEDTQSCITIDMMEHEKMLMDAGKLDAAVAFIVARIKLHECREIDAGTHVAVEKRLPNSSSFGNWYCIRPHGDSTCYWEYGNTIFGKSI